MPVLVLCLCRADEFQGEALRTKELRGAQVVTVVGAAFSREGFLSAPPLRILALAELTVALTDDGIVGFAWVVHRGAFDRSAYLRLIAVRADSHGRGVGRALMADVEAAVLGKAALMLLVTKDNAAARGFYERMGYQLIGTLPSYVQPGVDECIYFKPARL